LEKKIIFVKVVASPVCSYSQIPTANEKSAVPNNEMIWPIQMAKKAGIPVSCGFFMGLYKLDVTAVTFASIFYFEVLSRKNEALAL
jgi:hypothetical protein